MNSTGPRGQSECRQGNKPENQNPKAEVGWLVDAKMTLFFCQSAV